MSPAPEALDVNDVSILFPLPEESADIGRLVPLSFDIGGRKALISNTLFKNIFDKIEDETQTPKLKRLV